jgi:hypothetical protein
MTWFATAATAELSEALKLELVTLRDCPTSEMQVVLYFDELWERDVIYDAQQASGRGTAGPLAMGSCRE